MKSNISFNKKLLLLLLLLLIFFIIVFFFYTFMKNFKRFKFFF